ncbi:hypothetical protein AB6F20_06850 [Providencia hangzhouensis]|uniref:hypothetical protein n=1 Tax=Providencia hangzhouensis TaxID=3031799 RepID=UPI0034DD76F9
MGKEFKNPIILNPIKEGITDDGVLYFLTHNYDVPAYDFRDWQNSYFVNSGISDPKRNLEFLNRLLGGTVPISSLPVINLEIINMPIKPLVKQVISWLVRTYIYPLMNY